MDTLPRRSPPVSLPISSSSPTTTPLTLTMNTSTLSSTTTFTQNTPSSSPFCTLEAKSLSAHHRKILLSATNQPLLHLAQKLENFTLGKKHLATDPSSGAEVFRTTSNGEDTILTFKTRDGEEVSLKGTKPTSSQPHTGIVELASGAEVARISKEKSKLGNSRYEIEVVEGMDAVLVCALVGLMVTMGKNETSAQARGPGGGMA